MKDIIENNTSPLHIDFIESIICRNCPTDPKYDIKFTSTYDLALPP